MASLKKLIFNNRLTEKADLDEAAVSISQAQSENLSLWVNDTGFGTKMVLYDASVIDKMGPENWIEKSHNKQKLTGLVVGVISSNREPDVGAYEIDISAAEKGYGPLLYDMLSSHIGFIMADRTGISKDAQRVWKYIMTNRSDWEHEWIEDEQYRVNNSKKNPLNYKWRILSSINLSSLRANNKVAESKIVEVYRQRGKDYNEFDRIISSEASRYFDFRYEE